MREELTFEILTEKDISEISVLGQQINPKLTLEQIQEYLIEMFSLSTYKCFGLFLDKKLVGVSSGWVTVRFYSGRQLEVDNVVVDNSLQSKGLGKQFFDFIENWAKQNGCETIELNTYLQNSKSHKFYFNLGYSILGFHFWKQIQ
jgi:GNAT superfamily N-acetyltransferase